MTSFRFPNFGIISTLIALFITMQLAACSAGNYDGPVNSTDTSGTTLTNHAAVITGTDIGTVTEDNDPNLNNYLEVSGQLSITDSDTGEDAFIESVQRGQYGRLSITADGNWIYTARNSQSVIQNLTGSDTLQDFLTISSIDGTTHTVVITIIGVDENSGNTGGNTGGTTGTNQAAVISGTDNGTVTEDLDPDQNNLLEVSGKLNITDSDAGEAAFVASTQHGNYGNLTIDTAGNWSYAASNSQSVIQNLTAKDTLQDSLTISSIDGTTHAVTITIIGADEVSNTIADVTLSWVAPAQRSDDTALLLSEIAGYKVRYGNQHGSYSNSVTINDGSATGHTFTNFTAGTYYFVVTTLDTDGRESQYSSEATITIL